ncbi:MAG: CDP-diacylglycerol--glycerol-3-phosphate 3-phosphatidyltransferase [Actinomycetaceae bacterium]|nr:CDP-diacylglycerol--glycerol-3-phosphate 3-phosphatidyltransferase [Actinomycetaceae bacterium]MDY6083009.1 CDP-diacylglycerol--glycerol-3-phosphate 3-phosphatidyltransferase [Actinomycetaceae bacterium]
MTRGCARATDNTDNAVCIRITQSFTPPVAALLVAERADNGLRAASQHGSLSNRAHDALARTRGVSATESEKAPVVNIANALTVLRLVLVPVFVWVYWADTPMRAALAWAVFALAAGTDKLDGYLARSRHLVTNFGKLADSIADKALISVALVMLSWHGMLWWWVTVLLIAREVLITAVRMSVVKKHVMAAGKAGKIKMALQSFGIAGLLIPWSSFLPQAVATVLVWASWALIAVALYFSLTSAWGYIQDARRIAHEGAD